MGVEGSAGVGRGLQDPEWVHGHREGSAGVGVRRLEGGSRRAGSAPSTLTLTQL